MSDYIKRDKALSFPFANGKYDHKNANEHFIFGCESYKEWLEDLPIADVRENVHGEWKTAMLDHEAFGVRPKVIYCSSCCQATAYKTKFCPNCGAQMDGGYEP